MSKTDEVKAKLDEAGIEYDPEATLAELKALLPQDSEENKDLSLDDQMNAMDAERKEAEKVPELTPAEQKAAYLKIINAYKKQNPVKYELKKKAFEAKLATFK